MFNQGLPRLFSYALTFTLIPQPVLAQNPFVAEDIPVSNPAVTMRDEEFDWPGGQVTWLDVSRNLWVAKIAANGTFIPADGRGTLLDTQLATIQEIGNGPEWAYAAGGSQVVYTKKINGQYLLARAVPNGTQWHTELIPTGAGDGSPFGSKDLNDPNPRIRFIPNIAQRNIASVWLELSNPMVTGAVNNSTVLGGRWIEGLRSMTVTIQDRLLRQAAQFDIDTGELTQLTFDEGSKVESAMWPAPEFNNEYVLGVSIDQKTLGIYRKVLGIWTKVHTIMPPSPNLYIGSPEPFVYQGKSYYSYTTSLSKGQGLADVWIAGIDPAQPFYRQVSGSQSLVRMDPETYAASNDLYVYYAAIEVQNGRKALVVHRCASGLKQ